MTTFRPTTKAYVTRPASYDWQGQAVDSPKRRIRCAVIHLEIGQGDSSIRADRSETKGRASESTGKIRILVHPKDSIQVDDRVELLGHNLRVMSVFPRQDLQGVIHHYQVDLEVWHSK